MNLAEQCRHQVQLSQARMARFSWIGWLFGVGLLFSLLGLVVFLARFAAEGSPTGRVILLSLAVVYFGVGVGLWLMPFRPKPRIVPYFQRELERYGGATSNAFRRGRALYLELDGLDGLAADLAVRPLSTFGFADDYYEQQVQWHPAAEGLTTVDALRQRLQNSAVATAAATGDLDALAVALRAAVERGVDFSLVLRLHKKDNLQGVMTREVRQGSFW